MRISTSTMKVFLSLCCLLLCAGVTGCRTVSVYGGERLPRASVGVLDLRPGFSTMMDAHFHMAAVDGKSDISWGSQPRDWAAQTDPRYFELLPGRHVLSLDYVIHHRAGEQVQSAYTITTYLRNEISSLGVRTVTLTVEANHRYAVKRVVNKRANYGQAGNWQLWIIDTTTGRTAAKSSYDVEPESLDES